ncbi:MAG: serine/threonine-protein phosphatase [Prevotella sp.]|nr:serine/threonine-protein phosphatase [Prevotella sp.]
MLNLNITAASRVGCVRTNNEDMLLVGEWFVRNSKMTTQVKTGNTDRYLLALADGMGGHNSGEVASSDVLHNLQFFFNDIPAGLAPGEFNEAIYEWLQSINTVIDSKGHSDPKYRDMGTTLVAFAYYAGQFYWMNCGDSRLYRLHDGQLSQLTTDHSLSNLLGSTKHSNVITNCIGGGCKTSYIDMVRCTDEVLPGDVFLLCSDGLNDMISDADIAQLLVRGHDAQALCDAAEEAGGADNVSTIVVRIE